MPEPTIDEMLEYADGIQPRAMRWAIRAILEQHDERINEVLHLRATVAHNQLEAIRAFVERVEKRYFAPHDGPQQGYRFYMQKELAALEGEAAANE